MRSGVFGTSPEAAADVVSEFARGGGRPLAEAEILDAARATACTPSSTPWSRCRGRPPAGRAKSFTSAGSQAELDALCAATAGDLVPGPLYLFGPGSTTAGVLRQLGLRGTTLGVDAVRDGRLIGTDLSEQEIIALMDSAPATRLVLGVIGGQGFLLGRGNQQLGPAVLSRLGAGRPGHHRDRGQAGGPAPATAADRRGRRCGLQRSLRLSPGPDRTIPLHDVASGHGGVTPRLSRKEVRTSGSPVHGQFGARAARRDAAQTGYARLEDLFAQLPAEHRMKRPLQLPERLGSEASLRRHLTELLGRNTSCEDALSFLGGRLLPPPRARDLR